MSELRSKGMKTKLMLNYFQPSFLAYVYNVDNDSWQSFTINTSNDRQYGQALQYGQTSLLFFQSSVGVLMYDLNDG